MQREQKEIISLDEQIQRKQNSFKCQICCKYAKNPVVTPCGHIFCWSCLYKPVQTSPLCPCCHQPISTSQCYPVYTDTHQQSNQQKPTSDKILNYKQIQCELLPARPAAKHREKIYNPNMIGAGLPITSNNLPNNVNLGNLVAGHVFLSALGMNSLNDIQEGSQNDEDYLIGQKFRFKFYLIVVVTILVVAVFIISN